MPIGMVHSNSELKLKLKYSKEQIRTLSSKLSIYSIACCDHMISTRVSYVSIILDLGLEDVSSRPVTWPLGLPAGRGKLQRPPLSWPKQ